MKRVCIAIIAPYRIVHEPWGRVLFSDVKQSVVREIVLRCPYTNCITPPFQIAFPTPAGLWLQTALRLRSQGRSSESMTRGWGLPGGSPKQKCPHRVTCKGLNLLVGHVGIEPTTSWLRVSCSTNWANDPRKEVFVFPLVRDVKAKGGVSKKMLWKRAFQASWNGKEFFGPSSVWQRQAIDWRWR